MVRRRPMLGRQIGTKSSKIIYVSTKASFMSVVRRASKQLEGGGGEDGSSTQGLPLSARIAALAVQPQPSAEGERAGHEAVMIGAGRAIEKTLRIAVWFNRRNDCKVSLRTRTVAVIDDIVLEDSDEAEDNSRVRMVSSLEVTVRMR